MAINDKVYHSRYYFATKDDEQFKEKQRKYIESRKDKIKNYKREYDKKHLKIMNEQKNNFYKKERLVSLQKYSLNQTTPQCSCCGITETKMLAIDHINGKSSMGHDSKMGGIRLILWLKKHNYPEGFQVLSHNCNYFKYLTNSKCHNYFEEWKKEL